MMNASRLLRLIGLATLPILAACSQVAAPPVPVVAPFPRTVMTSEEQRKAIDDLAVAKTEQVVAAERVIHGQRVP